MKTYKHHYISNDDHESDFSQCSHYYLFSLNLGGTSSFASSFLS